MRGREGEGAGLGKRLEVSLVGLLSRVSRLSDL